MRTSLVKNLIQRNSKQFSGLLSIFRSIVHFQVYCPFSGLLSIFNYGSVQKQQQQQQKNDIKRTGLNLDFVIFGGLAVWFHIPADIRPNSTRLEIFY